MKAKKLSSDVIKVEETGDDVKKTHKMGNDVMNSNLLINKIEINCYKISKQRSLSGSITLNKQRSIQS